MELPRYSPQEVRSVSPGAGATALQAQASTWENLSNKLEQWNQVVYKKGIQQAEQTGKKEAEHIFLNEGTSAKINQDDTYFSESYNRTLQSLQAKQISIDTSSKMEELYQKHKFDPIGFTNEAEAYYKGSISEMPEHLKTVYNIDYEANKAQYFGNVQQNYKKQKDAEILATTNKFFETSYNKATQASRDGADNRAMYEAQKAEDALFEAKEAMLITPSQYEKSVDNLYKGVSDSKYLGVNDRYIEEDKLDKSQEFINNFRKEKNELYSDKEREKLADEMQRDLNNALRVKKAQQEASMKQYSFEIKDATKVYNNGKRPDNKEYIDQNIAYGTPKEQWEYNVAKNAYNITSKVSMYSLPEQRAIISNMQSKPEASRIEIESLKQAKRNINEKIKKAEEDPYSLGIEDGLYSPTNAIMPSQGNEALLQTLPIRNKQLDLAEASYGTKKKFFTDAEAQQYTAWINSPTTSIKEKLNFLDTIEESIPNDSMYVYQQLSEKGAGVLSFAGSLVRNNDRQKAEMILKGQIILREQPGVVPTKDLNWKLNATIGNVFRYGGENVRGPLSEASQSYYAALAEQEGRLSKEQAPLSLVKKAVTDITGGVGTRNDQNYFLPKGATEGDIEDWLDELNEDDFADVGGISPKDAVDMTSRAQLISVGDNQYSLIFHGAVLKDKNGKPFILEYSK